MCLVCAQYNLGKLTKQELIRNLEETASVEHVIEVIEDLGIIEDTNEDYHNADDMD